MGVSCEVFARQLGRVSGPPRVYPGLSCSHLLLLKCARDFAARHLAVGTENLVALETVKTLVARVHQEFDAHWR